MSYALEGYEKVIDFKVIQGCLIRYKLPLSLQRLEIHCQRHQSMTAFYTISSINNNNNPWRYSSDEPWAG
jgi:hypothetical protein